MVRGLTTDSCANAQRAAPEALPTVSTCSAGPQNTPGETQLDVKTVVANAVCTHVAAYLALCSLRSATMKLQAPMSRSHS
jgi:hypothetical protein